MNMRLAMSKLDASSRAEPHVQCKVCLDEIPETDATYAEFPGATIAFCQDCSEPEPHSYYGGI